MVPNQKMNYFRLSQNRLCDMHPAFAKEGRRQWQRFMDKIINKALYCRFILNAKGEIINEK
jgi:hypothetical protein